jgi:Phage integrase, N-terminal SAM-like domain
MAPNSAPSLGSVCGCHMPDKLPSLPNIFPPPAPLLDQVAARLRAKHYSLRTEEAYVSCIRRYIHFHGKRHPRDMGKAEVEAILSA